MTRFFSQFKYYFQLPNSSVNYQELKQHVRKSISLIPKCSYNNYMKYAYKDKKVRKYKEKTSSRRREQKNTSHCINLEFYILAFQNVLTNYCLLNYFISIFSIKIF